MEWFKKNLVMVIINGIITILLSIVGFSLHRAIASIDNKATKTELNQQIETLEKTFSGKFLTVDEKFTTVDTKIQAADKKIDAVKNTTDEKLELILIQIDALRKDLRLEQHKKE